MKNDLGDCLALIFLFCRLQLTINWGKGLPEGQRRPFALAGTVKGGSMKTNAACIILAFCCMAGQGLAGDDAPAVISPGGAEVAAVDGGCPTFSWSGVPWAKKYRVTVFSIDSGAQAPAREKKLATPPVLSQETAAGGTSWTPSAEQALADGQEYAWCVGALDADGAWTWSGMGRFRVDGSARRRMEEERATEAEKGALEGESLPQSGEAAAGNAGGRKSPVEEARSVQGTEGIFSTFYGLGAGANNSNDINANSFFGSGAGNANTSGNSNTFVGSQAGFLNNIGSGNTFLGYVAGHSNTSGPNNTFMGGHSGYSNTTGGSNTFMGFHSGKANDTGNNNTFIGYRSGEANTWASYNVFVGSDAGQLNTDGEENSFLGHGAGYANTIGGRNVFLGFFAGHANIDGECNTFVGREAGSNNTAGGWNTFIGNDAGQFNTTGEGNVALGCGAGLLNTTGSRNVFIGPYAGQYEKGSNKLYVDNWYTSSPLIYGEFDNDLLRVNGTLETTRTGVNNVLSVTRTDGASFKLSAMGASGQLGTISAHPVNFMTNNVKRLTIAVSGNVGIGVTQPSYPLHMASGAHCTTGGVWTNASSLALKENIAVLGVDEAAAALRTLNPVKYNYKTDASEKCVGFIAEEVPELVAQNDRQGLSPMDIVAVLTKVVQEQQKEIRLLKEEMAKLKRRSRLD